jgi:hypothetical protein
LAHFSLPQRDGSTSENRFAETATHLSAETDFVIFRCTEKLRFLSRPGIGWRLKLIGDRKPALIVLLRRRETNRAAASTMVYLRKIADQHKISFYVQADLDLS